MTISACADPDLIVVSKSIVGDPIVGSGNVKSAALSDGDAVKFAISVKNVGGESVTVDISDAFDSVFTGEVDVETNPDGLPTWTRTGPTGAITTGVGPIIDSDVVLASGQSVTYLVEATFSPEPCTSIVVNVVTVTLPGPNCCGENEVYDWAKVVNAAGPKAKLDPTDGWTAMEVLLYLLEGVALPDKVRIAKFINGCNTLADLINASGGAGDGVGVPILDALGQPTGLFAETSAGF